jgi:predicted tellurium resistance membrane protein TerC
MADRHQVVERDKLTKFILFIFLGIIAFFLIAEHLAHIIPVLPWLFLLMCPLMHLFMHGGHGGHGGGRSD